ncbi:hypothetical protein [Sphingobium sp. CECT 9361]|uniref:hypothetical protein n=1 Tax=Sphingobium sp. CECT 9361 TaxID=2845384 RepID=UPI001E576BBA|nr:hypothetical protein [Sphingobium sp. CECT 9361]CAH0355327.1 hypothetical protein SPH9361_03404 [Sphingobium sp. CECT 9361]
MARRRNAAKRADRTPKDIIAPTPEQQLRANYAMQDIVDIEPGKVAVSIGKAYRREPYFEELARREATGISDDTLRALRFYRNAWEAGQRSPVRSVLNRDDVGGGGDGPLLAALFATGDVSFAEVGIGATVHTLRAVALDDKSYAQVAMDRWGSREQRWILNGAHKVKIVPRSGKHAGVIRDEFLQAVACMTERVIPYIRTG